MPASSEFLRPKVVIKSLDGATTYHTYNAFDTASADIHITDLDLTLELYKASTAKIAIEDSGNTLNSAVRNGCKVLIDLGKTQGGLTRAFSGYIRNRKVNRMDTGTFDMVLSCYGSQIRFGERISNFFRMTDRTSFASADPDMTVTTLKASEVMKDLVQDTDHLPIGEPTESFSVTGIDDISEVIPSIKMPFTEWSSVAQQINDSVGTIWGVDENDSVFMRYPTLQSSGITIKDFNSSTYSSDGANTAYFLQNWSFEESIEKSAGFANRLYGRGGDELAVDQSFSTDASSTALYDRDLAIKIAPTAANLDAVGFVLEKVGTVASDVMGEVRLDTASAPGDILATFKVPIGNIDTAATNVLATVSLRADQKIQTDKALWLVLKKIGADSSNTIKWHRGTNTTGTNAYNTGASWTVQTSSYTFDYVTFYNRKVLAEASDPDSIDRYGVIEAVIDAPWIIEGRTMDKYLGALIQWTAKPKRTIEIPVMTIPDALAFPGYTAELVDTKTGFTTGNNAEILKVAYSFKSKDSAPGTNRMSMSLIQYPEDDTLSNRS